MSVKVDVDELADAMAEYAFAYLITVGDDYRAHTVVWPPSQLGGYTLIVDGNGTLDGRALTISPERVLHRPAGNEHDCVPIEAD